MSRADGNRARHTTTVGADHRRGDVPRLGNYEIDEATRQIVIDTALDIF